MERKVISGSRDWGRWSAPARALAGLLAGLLLLAGASGCGRHGKAAPVGGSDIPPSKVNLKRNVDLARAEQRSLVYYVDTVGVLEAEGQTELAAGVTGIVDEVLFREGDYVDPNTVLVKVDQKRYVSAAKIAEANVLRAEKNLDLAVDQFERAFRSLQGSSEEDKAKARLNRGIAEAEILSARANLVMARNNLDRSQVRPPYAGRINQRKITPGMYLEEKTVIATVADLSRIRLVGYVPETATPVVRELMAAQEARIRAARLTAPLGGWLAGPVPWGSLAGLHLVREEQVPSGYDPEFTLLAYPQQTFTGRIFYISTVASPDTHMFECKAEVNLRGLKNIELKPGYTARIRVPLRSNAQACVVPEEAVRASEQGFIAFVPRRRTGRDGQTEWVAKARSLEIGFRSPGWVEVRRGIQPDEWLVRRGAEALEDGTPIHIPESELPVVNDSLHSAIP
jgi:RND family efflux transporter MFP subunit